MTSSNIEDYLEQIYLFTKQNKRPIKTTELAKLLNINPSAITNMAKKLHLKGYIIYEPYIGLILTDDGEKLAKKIIYRHKIIQKFLIDYLKLEKEEASDEACKIEHCMSHKTVKKLEEFMNNLKK